MKPQLLALLAGLCWGIGELFTTSVLHTKTVGPITAIAVRSTVALPLLWLAYVIAVHRWQVTTEPARWLTTDATTLGRLIVGSGVIAGAGGMLFFYASISSGEISRVKPIAFATAPMVAVILGWLILGETMTPRKAAGVALILLGVMALTGE